MPALENPKWERFTQAIFKGTPADAAYVEAGYNSHPPNASRLRNNEKVVARLAELQERVAAKTIATVASISERLLRVADIAEQTGVDRDSDGKPTKSSSKHLGIIKGALMDFAKLNGLVVDRGQMDLSVEAVVEVQVSSDRERAKAMAALVAKARGAGNGEGSSS